MSQAERDRLEALKKANKKLITQKEAAEEIGVSERQVRRLLRKLRSRGDKAVIHALRGQPSNHRLAEATEQEAIGILSDPMYRGFGPSLAAEYLRKKHGLTVSKETLRLWMSTAGLWKPHERRVEQVHQWRPRRSRYGELVQWDTSDHDWLEGRGARIYLVSMIDDATSRLYARFVDHDSTARNMEVLRGYVERYGRPLAFYTDRASLFQTAIKTKRGQQREGKDGQEMPPTQIGRALKELQIVWIAAHSPQAKGRVERQFGTAQDRLVKGLRVAGACSLEEANAYLESEFLPWWNETLAVVAASSDNAHRPLGPEHDLATILSHVQPRQVGNDYTVRYQGERYQIDRRDVRTGLRGSQVEMELRLDGSMAMRFQGRYLRFAVCQQAQPVTQKAEPATAKARMRTKSANKSRWMDGFFQRPSVSLQQAIKISNASS